MDRRMDPEMADFNRMMEERATALPPIRLELPFDTPRALTEALNLPLSEGGPIPGTTATAGYRCAAGGSSAASISPPGPARIRCCSICMAAAGSGTASIRMTG
ncbi:MAG: Acetyl esterase [Belnapia sp.]|nr:Acetyl esterase [Belnapia sp.]